jgi:hypothetical protein
MKSTSGVPTALLALALAVACVPETFLIAEVTKRVGAWAILLTPPLVLGLISTFVFSVRFALPALDGSRKGGTVLAALALIVSVGGWFAATPIAIEAFQ